MLSTSVKFITSESLKLGHKSSVLFLEIQSDKEGTKNFKNHNNFMSP